MAIKSVSYKSEVILPIVPCGTVQLCLASGWAAKTVSGVALVNATVSESMRKLSGAGGMSLLARALGWNSRRQDVIQYDFTIDTAQFINTADMPLCAEITGVNPYGCAINAALVARPTSPPVVLSAVVPTGGTTLVLTFNQDILPATLITGFTARIGVTNNVIISATRTADRVITLTLTTTVVVGNTVTYSYVPGNVTDEDGNPLAPITNAAVTNSSTQV